MTKPPPFGKPTVIAKPREKLHVIDDASDDPPIEQPEALLHALRTALARDR